MFKRTTTASPNPPTTFTQHSATNVDSRSPFMPIQRGKSTSMTPPTSPSLVQSRTMEGGGQRQHLTPIHNLPSLSVQHPSPTEYQQSRKVIITSPPSANGSPSQNHGNSSSSRNVTVFPPEHFSTSPRIRAKLTPSATPRKKLFGIGESLQQQQQQYDTYSTPPVVASSSRMMGLKRPPTPSFLSPATAAAAGGAAARIGRIDENTVDQSSSSYMVKKEKKGGGRDNVLVCVRVRPPAARLAASNQIIDEQAWFTDAATGRVALKTGPSDFSFDSVVTGSDNAGVYEEAGRDLVLAAMEGFDAVIFAYGQTASGKTFTLSGNAANPGIIPQAVTDIFRYIQDHPEQEFLLRASYLEIYNETLKDLLAPDSGVLKIRQDERKRFFVSPLREEVVTCEAQVAALLKRGEENRHTGKTDFNERSSRSHSVFQMTIESRDNSESTIVSSATTRTPARAKTPNGPRLAQDGGAVRMSTLSLIDLAGSESATSDLERRSEGAFINKSLLTLEKVIASLTDESKRKPHVPYRDSKLTQILQPSLAGDARVAVIATMNPSPSAIEETKSTLKFAQRIKKVVLRAIVNEVVDDKALITKYRSHIAVLEAQLEAAMASQSSAPSTPRNVNEEADRIKYDDTQKQMRIIKEEMVSFQNLFLNSGNIEDRRQSMLPPRAVSPMKLRRSDEVDDGISLQDKYHDAREEIIDLKSELGELRQRILDLESEPVLATITSSSTDSEKDLRIAQLVQDNRELQVLAQNVDLESELRQEGKRWERQVQKCLDYEEGLVRSLAEERKRNAQFERYVLQHLTSQTDRLSISPAGFLPILSEAEPRIDIDDLAFSEQGRAIVRSHSTVFGR